MQVRVIEIHGCSGIRGPVYASKPGNRNGKDTKTHLVGNRLSDCEK